MDSEPVFTVATAATAVSIEAMPQPSAAQVAGRGGSITRRDPDDCRRLDHQRRSAVHAAKLWRWRQQGQQGGNELPGGGQRDDSDEWMDRGANGTPALPAYLGAGQSPSTPFHGTILILRSRLRTTGQVL